MGVASKSAGILGALAAALVSLLVGFAAMSVHDTQSAATIRSALVISEIDEAAPVIDVLRKEASRLHANFYRVRTSPAGRTPERVLSPIIGNRALFDQAFASGTYRRFDMSLSTRLAPMDGSARGGYLSTLSAGQLTEVASTLRAVGTEVQVQPLGWWALLRYMVGYTPAVMATSVACLAAAAVGLARAGARARRVAIDQTRGVRTPFGRDVAVAAALVVGSFALLSGLAAEALKVYNGGHQLPMYFAASGTTISMLFGAFLVGSCVAGLLPRRLRFHAAYSAWRPWGRGRVAIAAVQVLAVALATLLLAQTVVVAGAVRTVRGSAKEWASCASCTTTIFNAYDGPESLDEAVRPFAAAVRALELAGGVVLSWTPGSPRGDDYTPGDPEANVLVVNEEFIKRSGRRLPNPLEGREGSGEWGLLVPESRAAQAGAIGDAWRESLSDPLGEVPNRARACEPHIASYKSGPVFNYGSTDFRTDLYSDSPVIVVVPAAAGLLDDDTYFAAGTSGDLLFTGDLSATQGSLVAAGVAKSTFVVDEYATQVARGASDARAKLPIAFIAGVTGLIASLGLLIVGARAYAMRHRDRILFDRVHGSPPAAKYARLAMRGLALLSASGVVVVAGMQSGLTGSDIVPSTVWTVFAFVAGMQLIADAALINRFTTPKELLDHGR